jgi:hypothetical protein
MKAPEEKNLRKKKKTPLLVTIRLVIEATRGEG